MHARAHSFRPFSRGCKPIRFDRFRVGASTHPTSELSVLETPNQEKVADIAVTSTMETLCENAKGHECTRLTRASQGGDSPRKSGRCNELGRCRTGRGRWSVGLGAVKNWPSAGCPHTGRRPNPWPHNALRKSRKYRHGQLLHFDRPNWATTRLIEGSRSRGRPAPRGRSLLSGIGE